MGPLHSPREYLYNLYTTSSGEAKKIWRQDIKEQWNYECAYCGSKDNLTIDHVIPRCKGGTDFSKNVVCCCHNCNQDKSHTDWIEWFSQQEFFTEERKNAILNWMKPQETNTLHKYNPRKNKVY